MQTNMNGIYINIAAQMQALHTRPLLWDASVHFLQGDCMLNDGEQLGTRLNP